MRRTPSVIGEIGRSFLVLPAGDPPGPGRRTPIYLGPGRAFGSGGHETTVSCVEEMEGLAPLKGSRVLDVGTGTGILGLAALFLGAEYVVALDVDPDAARTASGNAALNGTGDRMAVLCGTLASIRSGAAFDLVLANIYGDVVIREAGRLVGHLSPGGRLIISGIQYHDSTQVKGLFERLGLTGLSVTFLEEYVTQVWLNPPAPAEEGASGRA